MPYTTIPTSINLFAIQQSVPYPSIHVPCMAPEFRATSLADARFTSVIAARARDAREMHSVSIVNFGAELGRPSTRLMFNSSHNVTRRFPSRCFVTKSAGLTVSRMFWILSSWLFSFCLQPKVLRCHVFDGPIHALQQHRSRFVLVLRVQALVSCWPTRWPHSHSVPCCSTLTPRCSVTPLSVVTTKLPRCVDQTRKHPPDVERVVFGQPAAPASESPSIITMFSSCCNGNSHTARGVWSRHRPVRFRRVRSARVAFPTARLHSLHANAMSSRSRCHI